MATTQDCIQIAMEETPRYEGAASTAPYRVSTAVAYAPVRSARITPNPLHDDRADEVRGIEGAPPQLIDGYEPAGSIAMRAYLNLLTYLLHISGWTGTATAGDGIITDPDVATIPATATRWVFTKRGGNVAKTAQMLIAYSDEGAFYKGQGYGISSWTLGGNGDYTADLMGLVFGNVADPNLTPVYDTAAIPHVRRGDLVVSPWLSGGGPIDDFTIAGSNPLIRRKTSQVSPASYFPDRMEHGDERVAITGTAPASRLNDAEIDRLLDGATFAATAKWKTPKSIALTAYKYSMWVEMPACQILGGDPDELRNARRFGGSWEWKAAWDETAGYDAKITIVNAVTAAMLETLA